MRRVVAAPRDLVFRVWTDPVHLVRWWGPHGFTNPRCEADARPGGKIHIDMRGPDGTVYPMAGEYKEVVPPERLVFTSAALDGNGEPLFENLNIVTFAEERGGTFITVRGAVCHVDGEGGAVSGWHGDGMGADDRAGGSVCGVGGGGTADWFLGCSC